MDLSVPPTQLMKGMYVVEVCAVLTGTLEKSVC